MTLSEKDALKRAGLSAWSQMSKEKLISFTSDLPKLDPAVAVSIVKQFPQFKELLRGAVDAAQEQTAGGLKFFWKGQRKVHAATAAYRDRLDRELDRENLTGEERVALLDRFRESVQFDADAAAAARRDGMKVVAGGMLIVMVSIGAAAAALGAKGEIGGGNSES